MTEAVVLTPATVPLRDWLRGKNVAAVVGQHVYAGGLPTGAPRPSVAISRVGGFADGPIDRGLYQLDSYDDSGVTAEAIDAALRTVLQSTPASTALTANLHFMGATEQIAGLLLHDPVTDEPRYSTTVEIVTKSLP